MSSAHWHLVLVHIPIVGVPFGLALLMWGLWRRSQDVRSAALVVFILCGLVAFQAKQTGDGAEEQLEKLPDFSKTLVHQHEEMADKAFLLTGALALASLAAMVATRGGREMPRFASPLLLALALSSSAALAYTGSLGGEIRHTEIRGDSLSPAVPTTGSERAREDSD